MEIFNIGFLPVRFVDLIDIAIVTYIIYKLYGVLKGSLALRILWLLIAVFVVWKLVGLTDLVLFKTILSQLISLGALLLVILFAPEIRGFLSSISKNTLLDRLARQINVAPERVAIFPEIEAGLQALKIAGDGALIVLEGNNPLDDIRETGDRMEAEVSGRLLFTIFQKLSSLHDGGMIIRGNRIVAVRCILPLSKSQFLPAELGLRHRAALGLSEQSDALVISLSEERQEISLAKDGRLQRNIDYHTLHEAIEAHNRQLA